jgi:hypothetical protein
LCAICVRISSMNSQRRPGALFFPTALPAGQLPVPECSGVITADRTRRTDERSNSEPSSALVWCGSEVHSDQCHANLGRIGRGDRWKTPKACGAGCHIHDSIRCVHSWHRILGPAGRNFFERCASCKSDCYIADRYLRCFLRLRLLCPRQQRTMGH